jgi:hypothetical protein
MDRHARRPVQGKTRIFLFKGRGAKQFTVNWDFAQGLVSPTVFQNFVVIGSLIDSIISQYKGIPLEVYF